MITQRALSKSVLTGVKWRSIGRRFRVQHTHLLTNRPYPRHHEVSGKESRIIVLAAATDRSTPQIDSPTSLRAFMQALQGKADSLRALAASFAPRAAAADAETLEKVQHAVKRLHAFVSIGHDLSQDYVRSLGRSAQDSGAQRALASHIVRIDVLISSVTAMKRSFECGGIDMEEPLTSLLASVRSLRETASSAEQDAQRLRDSPGEVDTDTSTSPTVHSDEIKNVGDGDGRDASSQPSTVPLSTAPAQAGASALKNPVQASEVSDSDSDSSVSTYDPDYPEDLDTVQGLHSSIQRQRGRLQSLLSRVESLQQLAASLESQEDESKGEQNIEALRNAVVELAKLRQMVENDDAALQSHDAALGAATLLGTASDAVQVEPTPPAIVAQEVREEAQTGEGAHPGHPTIRKAPPLGNVGSSSKPYVQRRRRTADMYTSRHLRKQEENERPRHSKEVREISERVVHEAEALRQQLREREAGLEGKAPPKPRSREEVWADVRRRQRRASGDYAARRASEGEAREAATALRRRSSIRRRPPPVDLRRDEFPPRSERLSVPDTGSEHALWGRFVPDQNSSRAVQRHTEPFIQMQRRKSYEARRRGSMGDEENQRRRGSVDFSQTRSLRQVANKGGGWSSGRVNHSNESAPVDLATTSKPFVVRKKTRPTRRPAGEEEENERRGMRLHEAEKQPAVQSGLGGDRTQFSVDRPTELGTSTPFVHKQRAPDYSSRRSAKSEVSEVVDDRLSAGEAGRADDAHAKPYVHRRRNVERAYAARRSSSEGGGQASLYQSTRRKSLQALRNKLKELAQGGDMSSLLNAAHGHSPSKTPPSSDSGSSAAEASLLPAEIAFESAGPLVHRKAPPSYASRRSAASKEEHHGARHHKQADAEDAVVGAGQPELDHTGAAAGDPPRQDEVTSPNLQSTPLVHKRKVVDYASRRSDKSNADSRTSRERNSQETSFIPPAQESVERHREETVKQDNLPHRNGNSVGARQERRRRSDGGGPRGAARYMQGGAAGRENRVRRRRSYGAD